MAIHTNTSAVYLCTNQELQVEAREEGFDFIFGTDVANNELSFFIRVKIRALEVKLTVIPDDTTANDRESDWGTELVIRPASTSYAALGIFDSIKPFRARLKEILEPTCSTIQHWDNTVEMLSKREEIIGCLNKIFTEFKDYQKPFLLHPIWKTLGKSPIIDKGNAYDIFVWSDFAICRTFIDCASRERDVGKVTRLYRSTLRLARILYELTQTDKVNIHNIYTQMAFNLQTDKEFALNGKMTRRFMNHPRRYNPIMKLSSITNVIMNGGHKELSPERRFDQSLYYTAQELFKDDA